MEILEVHFGCICFTVIMLCSLVFFLIIPLYKVIIEQCEKINRLNNYLDLYLDEGFIRQED